MKIYIVDDAFEVTDYGLPRCESLRNLVDFVCEQEDSFPTFRGADGAKGEDQFRAIIDSAGPGKPTTVLSLRKPLTGRCEPEDLEYRFDDSGTGRSLQKINEKLTTMWRPSFADVPLTVRRVEKDGRFEAGRSDSKFRLRLNFESKDKGIVWCTEPIQTVEALVVGAAKSGRRGGEASVDAVKRPRGRAPAGKTWDEQKGAWVEDGEEGGEEGGEEEDGAFGVALLRKLSTHELRISALVYTFANGKANTYVAREPLVLSLKKLGTKKPHERLQEARFKDLSRHIVHNGQAGNNTALALTALGVQHIETVLDFEEDSIQRAVAFLKALYRDERSETHTDVEDTMTPPPKKARAAEEPGLTSNESTAGSAAEGNEGGGTPDEDGGGKQGGGRKGGGKKGGGGDDQPANKLADAAVAAALAAVESISALEACLNDMALAYPKDVDTSHITKECAQAAADFFTQNHRFPTQEEGEGMLAEIKRAHIKDYRIGNLTKAQLEEVLHAVRASKAGPGRVKDIAAHFSAVKLD